MKKRNYCKKTHVCASVGLLALSTLMLMSCQSSPQQAKENATEASASEKQEVTENVAEESAASMYMMAPEIETDGAGLITLAQCPQTDEHLKVVLKDDNAKAEIYYDGELMQTIVDSEGTLVAAGGEIPVRFLDANFDGQVDIFIGPGESRTYSTLLVWNADKKEFVRIGKLGEPSLQGFMLEPATKSLYEGGSASWCMFIVTRSEWDGVSMKVKEKLYCISDPTQYESNGSSGKYSLRDENDDERQATEIVTELPGSWPKVVEIYDME